MRAEFLEAVKSRRAAVSMNRKNDVLLGISDPKIAWRRAILEEIAAHACEPGFCSAVVAEKLQISERYVRKLLRATGKSFSQQRLMHRLDRARALLTDPGLARLSVTDLSQAAGFGDVSHFNRCFRRRFGVTPTSVRPPRADRVENETSDGASVSS
jgi:AraC-like DNA-binding protein